MKRIALGLVCVLLLALAGWLAWVGIVEWLVFGLINVVDQLRASDGGNSRSLVISAVKAFFFEIPIAAAWLSLYGAIGAGAMAVRSK